MKKTKIVATVGPACGQAEKLEALILKGADVLRINASHTTPATLRQWIKIIRKAAASVKKSVGIIVDLQGPRVRTGTLKSKTPLALKNGEEFLILIGNMPGSGHVITTSCREFPLMVKKGDRVLLDNGNMELEVLRVNHEGVKCRVISGGVLGENKGINLPYAPATLPALTEKDLMDLRIAAGMNVDYIALSFIRSAEDVNTIKRWLKRNHKEIPVIAKIEKPSAVKNIDAVMTVADVMMIARGDLGIELGVEKVPAIQKALIELCRRINKPVITATQMLETMMEANHPTRAEVSDIANAVFDGTDAVMLSGETSIGKYPVESVRVMAKILRETEQHVMPPSLHDVNGARHEKRFSPIRAITHAAFDAANNMGAKAIVVFTVSGRTALLVSKLRPNCPIFVFASSKQEILRMTLLRGVVPILIPHSGSADEMIRLGDSLILRHGLLKPGDPVVLISGKQALPTARFMAKIHYLGER
ncbi:MAG: pyruvate kinase [Candidatus Omnitrophica bacterium]|nr:pyruvate kinase [Candidatus Omnitrophota bacterium]